MMNWSKPLYNTNIFNYSKSVANGEICFCPFNNYSTKIPRPRFFFPTDIHPSWFFLLTNYLYSFHVWRNYFTSKCTLHVQLRPTNKGRARKNRIKANWKCKSTLTCIIEHFRGGHISVFPNNWAFLPKKRTHFPKTKESWLFGKINVTAVEWSENAAYVNWTWNLSGDELPIQV